MELSRNQKLATEWVNEYANMLYQYVIKRVKDNHIAKDLVQDTLLSAWKNIENYTGEASVKTWLFTILKNKIIDHYRKSSNRITEELSNTETEQAIFFDSADHWHKKAFPMDWGTRTQHSIETKEFYLILTKCKNKLKEIQAAVFNLKYMEDLSSKEICKELNITESNYWVLIHRAKIQLRYCLESNWILK